MTRLPPPFVCLLLKIAAPCLNYQIQTGWGSQLPKIAQQLVQVAPNRLSPNAATVVNRHNHAARLVLFHDKK